jgi:hypothetical protein
MMVGGCARFGCQASEVDASVLAELPDAIRHEVLEQMRLAAAVRPPAAAPAAHHQRGGGRSQPPRKAPHPVGSIRRFFAPAASDGTSTKRRAL